jgi:predicted amidophosphoribosyltransferase
MALLYLMIGIGIFVYRDAGKRGMEPLVWVIVAVLVPYFIGLIAYLLVRQPILVTCPSCGGRAGSDASFCPACGKELKLLCAKCSQPMAGQARFCSHCGAEAASS